MASISKSQALALADGFLDNLGSDETFQPRNTISEVFLIAGELVEDSQKYLKSSNKNASGSLSSSIAAVNPQHKGDVVSMDIEMNAYGKFVNKGVKGTEKGTSTAGYKFTKKGPSEDFVTSIENWIKERSVKVKNQKRSVSRNEAKNKSVSEINKNAAWVIGRSIMRRGLKPTGFFDKAVVNAKSKYADRLGAALEIDITETLTQ